MTPRHLSTCLFVGWVALATTHCAKDNADDGSQEGGGSTDGSQMSDDRSGGGAGGSSGKGGKTGSSSQANGGRGGTSGDRNTASGGSSEPGGASGNDDPDERGGRQAAGSGSTASHLGGNGGGGTTTNKTNAGGGGNGGKGGGAVGSGGAGGGSGSCSISIKTKSLSTAIPTVGIVEWSTDLSGMTDASIEFGLDTKYGLVAPVDLKETNYRTLILGMKAGGKTYHFRVVAKAGDETCTSEDNTLPATGQAPNALPRLTITPAKADGLDGGFLVLETFQQSFGTASGDGYAFILDGDGDFVWWYPVKSTIDLSRAKQSFDGKYMWITRVNVTMSGGSSGSSSKMIRVKMDGTGEQDLSKDFADLNHDFAIRSDETVAFIAYSSNNCDDIKERSPSGTVSTIINSGTAVGASTCHCNAVQYDRNDDTIVFSEYDSSSYVKVTRDTKKVVWLMSSQNSAKATVTGISWKYEHGFHIISETDFLFFNNNTGPNSTAIETDLSITGGKGTAKRKWSYPSTLSTQFMGDVQRLSNGNTLVTFSTAGEIREVSSSGTVLQTIKGSGNGGLFGFSEKRKSLYGAPPR